MARLGPVDSWQFVVVGAVEEARDSEGACYVATAYHPQYLIVGEPNRWDRIALGYKGNAWARVTVQRTLAHTASTRESASETAVKAWLSLERFAEEFNGKREPVFDQLLLTLRGMESGGDGFMEWARIKVGARPPLDLPPSARYEQMEKLVQEARLEKIGFAMPAYRCAKNTPLVRSFLAEIRSAGDSPGFVYISGSSDLNIITPIWKIPALVYGPGDSSLDHTPDERISLEEYERSVVVLIAGLRELVQQAGADQSKDDPVGRKAANPYQHHLLGRFPRLQHLNSNRPRTMCYNGHGPVLRKPLSDPQRVFVRCEGSFQLNLDVHSRSLNQYE